MCVLVCRDKPLAMYIFSKNKPIVDRILSDTSSGGVTVNDTLLHSGCECFRLETALHASNIHSVSFSSRLGSCFVAWEHSG